MSLHAASVPVFAQYLDALAAVLRKAEDHATAKKIAPEVLLGLRLAPDMLPLSRQVQIACDFAKNTSGRLAGAETPKFADEEKTFAELHERIAKTKAFAAGLPEADFAEAASRKVTFPIAGKTFEMDGADYLHTFAMPNFFFHMTTAYGILRANGVDLGKRDFMGMVAGMRAVG
jgi:hypothetical protein